jgi:acetyl-CoA synthetase
MARALAMITSCIGCTESVHQVEQRMPLFTLETIGQARDWGELSAGFRWEVPARFNLARDCCRRRATGPGRLALYFEDEAGAATQFSFRDIQQAANRLSNALHAPGVQRGDRIGIVLPQRPETAIAHIAAYQMGAIALPLSHLFGPDALEYRLRDAAHAQP